MSARDRMTPEQRATLAQQLGDAQPARTELLASFGESVQNRAEHDHTTQREDWYCLNLSSYMGERMAPVLRRLINAESDAERYRTAWRLARGRAISTGGAADRYAARAHELQTALQDSLVAVIGVQIERNAIRAEVLREGADAVVAEYDRQLWATKPGKHWAADRLRSMADEAEQGQPAPPPTTIENYPGELAMLRGVLGVVRSIARHGDLGETEGGRELRRIVAEHYADERAAYAEQGEKSSTCQCGRSPDPGTCDPCPFGTPSLHCACACEQGEKDTREGESTPPTTERERHHLLLKAIRAERGEWTTHRVRKTYHALGISGLFRSTLRRDLAELCRDGHLVLHDQDPGRRYYTPSRNGGDAR